MPSLQAGSIAKIAYQAISLRSALHIAGPLGTIDWHLRHYLGSCKDLPDFFNFVIK